ncbi:MAG: MerR family transcriptional regulator [Alphaproteobacteria bacterium]|nr:MerR family transcriptional regulator [Alphaproteobacteria bacterium]
MSKAPTAFRTISEVSDELEVPKHVLRFWEMKFPQIKPMKRGGGRRYYRPEDMALLKGICHLLHAEAYTIKGVQKILRERGVDTVKEMGERKPGKKAGGKSRSGEKAGAATAAARPAPAMATAGKPADGTGKPTASKAPARARKQPAVAAREGSIVDALNRAINELQACRSALLGTPPVKRGRARAAG